MSTVKMFSEYLQECLQAILKMSIQAILRILMACICIDIIDVLRMAVGILVDILRTSCKHPKNVL